MHELFDTIDYQMDEMREKLRLREFDRGLEALEHLGESYEILRSEVSQAFRVADMESELFTSPKTLDETLDHILGIIKKEFGFSRFDIILVDQELRRVIRRYSRGGYGEKDLEKLNRYGALGVTRNYCLTHKEPWVVNDIKGQDPLWRLSLELDVWVHATFPLYQRKKDGTEELVGYLHGGRTKKDFLAGRIFTQADVRDIKRLGRAVINAIKEAKLSYFEQSVMRIQNVIGSTRIEMIQPTGHPDEEQAQGQMDKVMDTIIDCLGASMGGILVRENNLVRAACFRDGKGNSVPPETIRVDSRPLTGLIGRCLFDGYSVIENETHKAADRMDLEMDNQADRIHTFIAVPLIRPYSQEGVVRKNVIGTLILLNKKDEKDRLIKTDFEGNEGGFSSLDRQILESISPHIETIISNTQSHEDLQRMSITDGMTGLWNHSHFMNTLLTLEFKRSQRYGTPLSMLLLDIDHFKVFNDIFGHQVGDLVLIETAGIIRDNTRSVDHIARYGGEEFAVLLHNTPIKDAQSYAAKILRVVPQGNFIEKISERKLFLMDEAVRRFRAIMGMEDDKIREAKLAVMKRHFDLNLEEVLRLIDRDDPETAQEMIFRSFKVTLSIGMAYYPDPRIITKKDLLTTADMLLLKAKENGRNRVESVEIS
jgi:diguanylate cyclase (GGDEF)-like protein